MNELQKQQRKQVTYGFHQISGKKAEDRGTMVLYHTGSSYTCVLITLRR